MHEHLPRDQHFHIHTLSHDCNSTFSEHGSACDFLRTRLLETDSDRRCRKNHCRSSLIVTPRLRESHGRADGHGSPVRIGLQHKHFPRIRFQSIRLLRCVQSDSPPFLSLVSVPSVNCDEISGSWSEASGPRTVDAWRMCLPMLSAMSSGLIPEVADQPAAG